MLVLVMSHGGGEEANVGGGPNRNPPPKLNILPPPQTLHHPLQITHLAWHFLLPGTSNFPCSACKQHSLASLLVSTSHSLQGL